MERIDSSLSDDERSALARLETTIDARIDAALVLAEYQYVAQARVWAMVLALGIALGTGFYLVENMALAFLVGITAVPLAPVAKDLASALQEAVKALRKQ